MGKQFLLIADSYYNGFFYMAQRVNGTILKSEEVKRKEEWLKQFNLKESEVDIKCYKNENTKN